MKVIGAVPKVRILEALPVSVGVIEEAKRMEPEKLAVPCWVTFPLNVWAPELLRVTPEFTVSVPFTFKLPVSVFVFVPPKVILLNEALAVPISIA